MPFANAELEPRHWLSARGEGLVTLVEIDVARRLAFLPAFNLFDGYF
jgi:hypothetical protein